MTASNRHEPGRAPILAFAALAGVLLGCSEQVDGAYQGEPLATIQGTVTSTDDVPRIDRPVSAAIMWIFFEYSDNLNQVDGKFVGERVAVRGSFPANFTLNVYTPPPTFAQLRTLAGPSPGETAPPVGDPAGIWWGLLVAVDSDDDDVQPEDILGVDMGHVVLYLEGPVLPASSSGLRTPEERVQQFRAGFVQAFNIPSTPGYHLAKVNPAYRLAFGKLRECDWVGTCIHWMEDSAEAQSSADSLFRRCQERFPQQPTCSAYRTPRGADEPAESIECRAQYQPPEGSCVNEARQAQNGLERYLANPADLTDPVTIQMGLSSWDALEGLQ